MVLSGTDYNMNGEFTLRKTLEWYKEYKLQYIPSEQDGQTPFYGWLLRKSNINNKELISICDMFNINDILSKLKVFDAVYESYLLEQKQPNLKKIQEIMVNEGFIFV